MKKLFTLLAFASSVCLAQNPRFMGSYNKTGIPEYEGKTIEKADSIFLKDIYSVLPEKKSVFQHHPEFLSNSLATEMKLMGPTTIWVTFANESADWTNTFGYYYYNEKLPAESAEDIEQVVIFPNVSKEAGLVSGTKIKLGNFKAGTVIGWFIISNGWQNGKVTDGFYTLFSNPRFNPESDSASRQHVVFLNSLSKKQFVVGFEDTRRDKGSDNDFNDMLFYVTLSNMNALDSKNIAVIKDQKEDKKVEQVKDPVKDKTLKENNQKDNKGKDNWVEGDIVDNKDIKNKKRGGNGGNNTRIVNNTTIVNNNYGNNNVNNTNANTAANSGGNVNQKNNLDASTETDKKTEVQKASDNNANNANTKITTTEQTQVTGCAVNGFSDADFLKTYNLIKSKPTEESRKSLMTQAVRSRKLTVDQTIKLLNLFAVSRYRLDVAKYLFDFSCQKKDYYMISKVFNSSSYERDFDEWLGKQNLEDIQVQSTTIKVVQTQNVQQQPQPQQANYTGSCNGNTFGGNEFGEFKSSIKSKTFSETMKTVLKQGMQGRCIEVFQVKELMGLFSFEADKIEMAKYLYDFTIDKQNYYKVNDVFDFSTSVDELNDYLKKK